MGVGLSPDHVEIAERWPRAERLGLAHGITWSDGIRVPGHRTAIERFTTWLDAWLPYERGGLRWPEAGIPAGRTRQKIPLRPSWCYSTGESPTPGRQNALR
ncbi:hypothetical protein [Kitasatospora sp. NPDC057223]|uniref:hypothetical protein n=1 Tax=Kitasatospora sp. NPDC057223 TaxID=3346055 RepID=UPI00362D0CF4